MTGQRSRRWVRRGWIGLCLSWAAGLASGETPQLRLDHLSADDGLSHPQTYSIAQDPRGFLWFGTQDGLNRYDSNGFRVFRHDPEDPDSLADSGIREVYVDTRGELWLATDGGGLDRYLEAEERFLHYRNDPADASTLSNDTVWTILEDRAGRIWVGTEDGLNLLDRETGRFTRYLHDETDPASLPARRVMALASGPDGSLWIGLEAGGLARFDASTGGFRRYPVPPSLRDSGAGTVISLAFDEQGGLWIGTDFGFGRIQPDTGQPVESIPTWRVGVVFGLLPSRNGHLWIGSYTEGLGRLELETGRLTMFATDPADPGSMRSRTVFSLYEDRTGSLWIGTREGVAHLPRDRDQFALFRSRPRPGETIASNRVRGLYEDHRGTIWVGTGEGLAILDRERHSLVAPDIRGGDVSVLRSKAVSAIEEDHRGHLWAGLWFGGIVEIDADRRRATHHAHDPSDPDTLCGEQVRSILEDRARRLWIATYNGICRYDAAAGRFVRYPSEPTEPEALGFSAFWTLLERRNGELWFGSLEGLFRLDPESGRFDVFRFDPSDPRSLGNNKIMTLFEDSRQRLWIGTLGGGLHRLDASGRGFVRYQKRDGLAHDTVEAIAEDREGHLWISTSGGGLSRFDPATEAFATYTVEDGLQGNFFSSSSALASSSGELFFGGSEGLTGFAPENLAPSREPAPVVLTQFYLFNEPAPLRRLDPSSPLERSILHTSEIHLTWRQYLFGLEFATLDYVNTRRVQFEYRLDNFDREWIPTDSTRGYVQYTNLQPGHYVFRVRARSSRGRWSDETSLRLVVHPPPWRTWWAYTLYGLTLVVAVLGFVRSQRKELRREREAAEHERAVSRRLREVDKLKDEYLAKTSRLVSERTSQLAERERLIAELEARNAELARFNHAVAHDLKNPMTTILNFIGRSVKDFETGEHDRVHRDLQRIDRAASKLHRLLEELHEFSRIDRASIPREEVAFGELARQAADELDPKPAERGIEIEVAEDLPVVRGDRARLLEVVRHLLGNAVKYLGNQPAPRIEVGVRTAPDGGVPVFYVRDNGEGIDPRYHDKIFGLFERLAPETSEGTGIGLALVKRIVEVHDGRIWVESDGEGCGSTFCFTLSASGQDA